MVAACFPLGVSRWECGGMLQVFVYRVSSRRGGDAWLRTGLVISVVLTDSRVLFFLRVSVQSDRLHQSSDTLTHDQCLSCESESLSAMPAETLDAIDSEPWMANDPVIVRDWHAYSFALRVPNLLPVA